MPQSARKAEAQQDRTPETYRATQRLGEAGITVVRTPARRGFNNTFVFESVAQMRTALRLSHPASEVEDVLKDLADSGSVEFTISDS